LVRHSGIYYDIYLVTEASKRDMDPPAAKGPLHLEIHRTQRDDAVCGSLILEFNPWILKRTIKSSGLPFNLPKDLLVTSLKHTKRRILKGPLGGVSHLELGHRQLNLFAPCQMSHGG
jgi:hypothetical protein